MFQNWGFLITEMVVLLVLAIILGLVVGWLLWGRRNSDASLSAELETCRAAGAEQEARITFLEAELAATGHAGDVPARERVSGVAVKPATLDAPRGGVADDLKMIKGVGPKLETLVHSLGYYHFDQIADWTADEVAWVDENLEGFKGRVTRDGWVEQARLLAAGGGTEFSDRVKKGDVY